MIYRLKQEVVVKKVLLILSIFSVFLLSCGGDETSESKKKCEPSCEEWKSCNNGTCELRLDRCDTDKDCENRTDDKISCNTDRHECETVLVEECTSNEDCKDSTKPVCKNNKCVADSNPVCSAGEKRCNENKLETCNSEGNAWELTEDCNESSKTCNSDSLSCESSESNCIGMSFDTIEVKHYKNELIGLNGDYQLTIGFYDANSPVGIYNLGVGNNKNYSTCNQCTTISKFNGEELDKTFFQVSGKLEITEGDGRTGESVGEITNIKLIEVTIEDGTFISTPVENGECIEIETGMQWKWNTLCTEGNRRCNSDDNTIEICNADHTWSVEKACLETEECTIDVENGIYCKAPYCIAGEKRCNENGNVQICKEDNNGNFWDIFENCTNGTVCEETDFTCIEPPCTNDDKKCNADNTGVKTCVNHSWTEELCAVDSGEICMGSGNMVTCGIPASDANWIKVSINSVQSCGIKSSGGVNKLYCWGTGSYGRLGNGTEENKLTPTEVNVADNSGWTDVSVGAYHACGLKDGKIYCWGRNNKGQLGTGNNDNSMTPVEITGNNADYLDVESGEYHVCGLKANGKLYCWGRGESGQLGNDSLDNTSTPVEIAGNWVSISLGDKHSCGIQEVNGIKKLYCWGSNSYGRLGIDSDSIVEFKTPTEVYGSNSDTLNKDWIGIYSGHDSNCAIKTTGKMYCWGHGNYHKLGLGDTDNRIIPTEITGDNWLSASVGYNHICGIQDDSGNKIAFCWGKGTNGRLGLNSEDEKAVPTQLTESGWIEMSGALSHTCGIKEENGGAMQLYCWGKGSKGRLGTGNEDDKLVPVLIP